MPKIHVIYDPTDEYDLDPDNDETKCASLDIKVTQKSTDIYNLARRVAELLLEQL